MGVDTQEMSAGTSSVIQTEDNDRVRRCHEEIVMVNDVINDQLCYILCSGVTIAPAAPAVRGGAEHFGGARKEH